MSTIQGAEIEGRPSHEDIRTLLRKALNPAEIYGPETPWVVECGDTSCVVSKGDRHFRYPYTIEGGEAKLGEPVEVTLSWKDRGQTVAAGEGERGTLAFATDLRGLQFSENASDPVTIEVCRDGRWKHPEFGEVVVDLGLREKLVQNFQDNVREVGDLPLDYNHEPGAAPGWIKKLWNEGNSLFADVELTPSGRKSIQDGEYRFFSPEWHPNWENPKDGKKYGPTLFGGGLTNRPFFRGMAAIQCSETGAQPQKEIRMPDTQPGAQTGQETPENTIQMAELQRRLQAVEVENATLRAAEARRQLTDQVGALTFGERRSRLAPAAQSGLVDALMEVEPEKREKVLAAVQGFQFAELGERGFTPAESNSGAELTAEEEAELKATAERNNLKFEEVKATYLQVKRERQPA